jgi:hypothetical protein
MINNSFLERLEELAIEKKNCEIIFLREGGKVTIQGRVERISGEDGSQLLKLQSGLTILVDQVISVDGMQAWNRC